MFRLGRHSFFLRKRFLCTSTRRVCWLTTKVPAEMPERHTQMTELDTTGLSQAP